MPARSRRSANLFVQLADLWFATPQVLALRLSRMAVAGGKPSASDRAEMRRMGSEKVAAFTQSWAAMCMNWWLMPLRLAPAWARSLDGSARSGRALQRAAGRASTRLLAAGVAPVRRKVVANAARLTRKGASRTR